MVSTEPGSATGPDVVAAGAVVTREGGDVLLVHRPKYDDWAFPKGKQDRGEHIVATAVREVLEETGVQIRLGRPLLPQLYTVGGGRAKTVHYWVGRAVGDDDVSGYQANQEIDAVGWFDPDEAADRLSYLDDVKLLEECREVRRTTHALVVLRHARARDRKTWEGEDRQRPLSRTGKGQAKTIRPVVSAYGVTRVVTSDSLRCRQSVAPYAQDHDVVPEEVRGLSEEDFTDASVAAVLDDVLTDQQSTLVCTHRPVLPVLLDQLEIAEEPLAPGEMVVVHHRKQRVVAVERHLARED